MTIEANWHNDGHVMHLELNKAETNITSVSCPDRGECFHREVGCMVQHFLDVYGLECNVGVTTMAADVPVAWTLIGKEADLDACQMWVIPTADEFFQAWVGPDLTE